MNEARLNEARPKTPYWITVTFTNVAAGSSSTAPAVPIGPRAFIWTEIAIVTEASITGSGSDRFSILIRDEGASENFTRDAVDIYGVVDITNKHKKLAHPWRFAPHTALIVEVRNNDPSNAGSVKVTLHGYLE